MAIGSRSKIRPQTPQAPPPPPSDAPNELAQVAASLGLNVSSAGLLNKADPDVWVYRNPFTDIWNPNAPVKDIGYTKVPKSKVESSFYTLSPDELKRFQELAFQAGYYGDAAERADIPFGARDPETLRIWQSFASRAALALQAGRQWTIWDLLQQEVENRAPNAGKKKDQRGPLVTTLPDPRELEETVRVLAADVIGKDPSEEFISDFVAMYTRMQKEFQENKYALAGTEAGGTITAPPSAESIARFRLRTENPGSYEMQRAQGRQREWLYLLKGIL